MDERILYIIFLIVWVIYSIFKGVKKASKNKQPSSQKTTVEPGQYKSILEKMILGEEFTMPSSNKEAKNEPEIEKDSGYDVPHSPYEAEGYEMTESAYEQEGYEMERRYEREIIIPDIAEASTEPDKSYSFEVNAEEKILGDINNIKEESAYFNKDEISQNKKYTPVYKPKFNLRQALISQIILDRPYK